MSLRSGVSGIRASVSLGNSKESKSVGKLANEILDTLNKLGLQSVKGKQVLAATIATKVLQTFLLHEVNEDELAELPFHAHLSAYCLHLLEYEQMFELPDLLFERSDTAVSKGWFTHDKLTTSELWKLEESLKQKDLLKETGTEIFGRFFIAMIAQAAQERSVIDKDRRMPTYVYVDEASDYYDHNISIILSQARKMRISMLTATQFLSQMENKLQDAVFANTTMKFAGGVSAKDANILAREMRTDAATIESQEKLSFAAFIKGTTRQAISISIKPGVMESLPTMSKEDRIKQRDTMRERYATHYSEIGKQKEEDAVVVNTDPDNQELSNEPMVWE